MSVFSVALLKSSHGALGGAAVLPSSASKPQEQQPLEEHSLDPSVIFGAEKAAAASTSGLLSDHKRIISAGRCRAAPVEVDATRSRNSGKCGALWPRSRRFQKVFWTLWEGKRKNVLRFIWIGHTVMRCRLIYGAVFKHRHVQSLYKDIKDVQKYRKLCNFVNNLSLWISKCSSECSFVDIEVILRTHSCVSTL